MTKSTLVKNAATGCLGMVMVAMTACGNLDEYPNENAVFQATFGTAPPRSVSHLQGFGSVFRDSSHCYLKFEAPFHDVQAFMGSTFTEISAAEFAELTKSGAIVGPTPGWWSPPTTPATKYFSSTGFHPHFPSGRALLAFETTTNLACFFWDGSE
jgi:hypothetical protein